MGFYGTARPANINDTTHVINGSPVFLGVIVSSGVVTNNATTAIPFNSGAAPQGAQQSGNPLQGTLAGKVLLLQPTAGGSILAGTTNATTLTAQSTTNTPAVPTGPLLNASERVIVTMLPSEGWLQWLPTTGAANLFVWELR